MIYLGVRPRGTTPLFHVNGRETFLAGIRWDNGWPVVLEDSRAAPLVDTAFVDRFTGTILHPRWVSTGKGLSAFAESAADGGIALRASGTEREANLLSVRAQDPLWVSSAEVRADGYPALRLRSNNRHWYEVSAGGGVARVTASIGGLQQTWITAVLTSGVLTLRIAAVESELGGPNDVVLSVITGGRSKLSSGSTVDTSRRTSSADSRAE